MAIFIVICTLVLFSLVAGHQQNATLYRPLFEKHSNSTPVFGNTHGLLPKFANSSAAQFNLTSSSVNLRMVQDLLEGQCAPGIPCTNGACCNKGGFCGYGLDYCETSICISRCNATAPCGRYAKPENEKCPVNVCCSQFGNCGTTTDFCDAGCQKGFGSCGKAVRPVCGEGSVSTRTVGYFEAWAPSRPCDKRLPSDIDLTGFTHLNFAFAYFHPSTFEITPMQASDTALYPQFTGLKAKKPSLKTYISVGGWAFNDDTNVPNTQKAFSDMASNPIGRRVFISSLLQFMLTWGFDGVDLDWEYPGAKDRGGSRKDTENLVILLKEMRNIFGSSYGITVTLPVSYWYLRGFDLKGMSTSVDWFNMMTYDIHGTWDKGNKFTGAYARPHTNLTEIDEGLDLLWRNSIDPSQVVLGLGWYGRSFTLENPSCTRPWCKFSAGGCAGECSGAAGILSNAEINRIIRKNNLTPSLDIKAAVKWIVWDRDQWVSYDDGETMQMKIHFANKRCLGGIMIWAVDQDDEQHTSSNDLMGIGMSNGISPALAEEYRDQYTKALAESEARNSCYWSFCGGQCLPGFFDETWARGQVPGIQRPHTCSGDQVQTLCCASGTQMGTCKWEGWRGVGMSCDFGCDAEDAALIAANSNHYYRNPQYQFYEDQSCHGGYQAYCCSGFKPSPSLDTSAIALVGQNGITKRDIDSTIALQGRTPGQKACVGVVSTAGVLLGGILAFLGPIGAAIGVAVAAASAARAVNGCPSTQFAKTIPAAAGMVATGRGGRGRKGKPKGNPKLPIGKGKPKVAPKNMNGQWLKVNYGAVDPDCAVTYTCRYNVFSRGGNFNEICDNQRWAIDQGLNGQRVYHYRQRTSDSYYDKDAWGKQYRKSWYRTAAQVNDHTNKPRCQVDEFPMGSLQEGLSINGRQICRLVNGVGNGNQGTDFQQWLAAVYRPCARLRKKVGKPEPPITWAFDYMGNAGSRDISSPPPHFIKQYGFDSQTPGSECWATFEYSAGHFTGPGNVPLYITSTSTVHDHGFRALPNDPIFGQFGWPQQAYLTNPFPNRPPRIPHSFPTDVASANWLKRREVVSILAGQLPLEPTAQSAELSDGADISCSACDLIIDGNGDGFVYKDDGKRDTSSPAEAMATDEALRNAEASFTVGGSRPVAALQAAMPINTGLMK